MMITVTCGPAAVLGPVVDRFVVLTVYLTFRRRSVAKQKGMVFGFRKTATAVTRPER